MRRLTLTILPPGENGGVAFDRNTTDQAKLYDALTPLGGNVTERDLRRFFKPAPLVLAGKAAKTERPRAGVTIKRDSFGVPYVTGRTQEDVAFGAGYATAEDRGLLLALIRGPARAAALDIPGVDPIGLALSGRTFVPSAQAEAFLSSQIARLNATGPLGKRFVRIVQAYAAGINRYYKVNDQPTAPYTANDVIAAAALIAARFGANGGCEAQNAQFLSALQSRSAPPRDVRSSTTCARRTTPRRRSPFPRASRRSCRRRARPEASSSTTAASPRPRRASPRRCRTRSCSAAAGQRRAGRSSSRARRSATSSRSSSWRSCSPAAGFDARGALFPGVPFVVIGRGKDYAWSATSSQADNIDLFAETLCGGDDQHYLYKGTCRAMTRFDAGILRAANQPDRPVSFLQTVHGPVQGYATVGGRRVAIALQRSTRGRELLSAQAFYQLDTNQVTSAKSFLKTMSAVEFSFNWFYADSKDIALFSSGRLPLRAPGTDPALPTVGTGEYDWRGFIPASAHAQGINPPGGAILNWNNKPATERRLGRLELLVRLRPASRPLHAARRGAPEAHRHQPDRRDEQGGDAGPARDRGLAGDPRRPAHGSAGRPVARARRPARGVAREGRQPARRQPRREGRRPRRGAHGRCLAAARRRGASARSSGR